MEYILLIAGFILLIKGADFFVDGSSSVAKKLKVPSLIIGLTIVAMGTSMPECSVSIKASLNESNELAISNAIGSNIFNLMIICGICSLFCPIMVRLSSLTKEFPFCIGTGILLLFFGFTGMQIGHAEGAVMLTVFILFLAWMVISALSARKKGELQQEEEYKILPLWKCLLCIVGGMIAIIIGGDLVVDNASIIAVNFGMSDNLVGLTIVAFGTSLPELVTSIVAARKHEVDMALGNVIGSNIFNILLVLGLAAAISPIEFTMENIIDIILLTIMSIIVWIFSWTQKKIVRWEGIAMLLCYAGYFAYICAR